MKRNNLVLAFSLVFEIGFLLATPIVVLLLIGLWADRKFHTFPILTLIGTFAGFAAGIFNTYRTVSKLTEKK